MLYIFSILHLLNSLLVLYIYVSVQAALNQTYVANYLCCLFQSINANCAVTIGLANKTRAWTIDLFSVQILETR